MKKNVRGLHCLSCVEGVGWIKEFAAWLLGCL